MAYSHSHARQRNDPHHIRLGVRTARGVERPLSDLRKENLPDQ